MHNEAGSSREPDVRHECRCWISIGGGNMARAIIRGGIDGGATTGSDWAVADPDVEKQQAFMDIGAAAAGSAEALARYAGPGTGVLLAVKPQLLGEVRPGIQRLIEAAGGELLVVSILAGVPVAALGRALPGARVVRAMPNTPAAVGAGMTAIASGGAASGPDGERVRALFEAVGRVVEIDEGLMDAFTAVAGSGPAYVFRLVEAIAVGAQAVGFEADQAGMIARQTVIGAAQVLARDDRPAEALREAVTSKGGTTAAGLAAMNEAGLVEALVRGIEAARDRGRSLARESEGRTSDR